MRFSARIAIAVAIAFAFAPGVAVADTGGQATGFQIDAAHDGYQPNPGITLPLQQQWQVALPSDFAGFTAVGSPVVVGGVVYATSGKELYAINLATGQTIWQRTLGGYYPGVSPVYDHGMIYASGSDGEVVGLDPTTGATVWSHDLGNDPGAQQSYDDPPTAADGNLYINGTGSGNSLFALSEATGALSWQTGALDGSDTVPAVDASDVYTVGACDQDYDFNPATGALIWHHDGSGGSGGGGAAPAVLGDGHLYGIDKCVGNVALSADTGADLGSFSSALAPAIANGVLYTVNGGALEAISDGGLGAVSWSFTPSNDTGLDDQPLVAGDVVYVGSSSGYVYAVDIATGTQVWSANVGGPVPGFGGGIGEDSGLAVADQALLVPTRDTLTAYSDGPPSAAVTGTAIQASPSPVPLNQLTTLTATVSGGDGGGTVAFYANGTAIAGCGAQTLTGGASATATCATNSLPGGQVNVEAAYSGDTGYYDSSGWASVTVLRNATDTSVTATPSGSAAGTPVSLRATVGSTDGGGTVKFSVGGSDISGCEAVPLASTSGAETATCTTSLLPVGSGELVTASYSGDNAYDPSSGSTDVTVLGPTAVYRWSGAATSTAWSSAGNWAGGISPNGTIGGLAFPPFVNAPCNPPTDEAPCHVAADNDIPGLSLDGLSIDPFSGYVLGGDAFTLGPGGLGVVPFSEYEATGPGAAPIVENPITLTADPHTGVQYWDLEGGPTVLDGAITGSPNLITSFDEDLNYLPPASVEPRSIEVGSIQGQGNGGFYLDGRSQLNSADGNPTVLTNEAGLEADGIANAVGPLTITMSGWLSVGGVDDGAGQLAVHGPLTIYASGVAMAVDAAGTVPGVDYSQITATGTIQLSGSLQVSQGADAAGNCDDLGVGQTLTLLTTTGTLNGSRFDTPADGSSMDIVNNCNGADRDASGTLHYTANSVTLTITNAGDAGDVPVEVIGPSISGTAEEGHPLVAVPGEWQGQTSFSYNWWDCNDTDCTQIPGATSATYVPTSNDIGQQIVVGVSANDAAGSNTDYSDNTADVTSEAVPADASAPSISGNTHVGDVLTATPGSWSSLPTSYAYKWQHCSGAAMNCSLIGGATTSTYTLSKADLGARIAVQVTASNYAGSGAPANSPATSAVTTASVTPPSATAITSALKAIAKPAATTSLAQILRRNGYRFRFSAPAAGKLVVVWTTEIKRRRLTVGTGSAVVNSARTVGVRVKLTAAGKAALERFRRVRIKSRSRFKTTGVHEVTYTTSFTLTRSRRRATPKREPRSCLRQRGFREEELCRGDRTQRRLATILTTLRKAGSSRYPRP